MHNLKHQKGTFKGMIGECMFKLTRKWLVLTQYFNIKKYMMKFGHFFTQQQKEFLRLNWYSIDGIEIVFRERKRIPTLYEIKTKNQYKRDLGFKPKTTLSTYESYEKAKIIGFDVKLVLVLFKENWDYDIQITDFLREKICIDKPKKWDKK